VLGGEVLEVLVHPAWRAEMDVDVDRVCAQRGMMDEGNIAPLRNIIGV
jgi:hypothetical protein